MTRFLYIADTHIGANPIGYQQQKAYPEHINDILAAFRNYMAQAEDIDFVLHGGDMIDATTPQNIALATSLFEFPVPVYLCLGNHDVTTQDAVDQWLTLAPSFFIDGGINCTINTHDCLIHVVPTQWCDKADYWSGDQNPHLQRAQEDCLTRELCQQPDLPHILLTHSPVYGLPAEQTGMPESYHAPQVSFTSQVETIVNEHASLSCVLGAHNHMNMRMAHGNVEFVTVSALVETPFEFKLFEVDRHRIKMSTVALASGVHFTSDYDDTRTYVQGRAADRAFQHSLRSPLTSR